METMDNPNNTSIKKLEAQKQFDEDLKKGFCKKSVENLSPKELEEEMKKEKNAWTNGFPQSRLRS